MLALLKQTFKDFGEDECPRMAASMSYFTAFSLAPLLVLILLVVGLFVDPADMQGRISTQIGGLIGADGAAQIEEMIAAANKPGNKGVVPTVLGIVALLFGATGAFGELQSALNRAWEVKPDPRKGGIKAMLAKRVMSLGLVGTIAFLLLVSLVISAALSAFGDVLGSWLGGISGALMQVIQLGVSLVVIAALFAVIFKVLPDAKVSWKDVWAGAAFTTVLFVAGKYLIGFYLSKSDPGSSFGAAGAFAVLMVWIYYSAMILFLGAEFTQVWATSRGRSIEPEEGAVKVHEQTILEDEHGNRVEEEPREGARKPLGKVATEPRISARVGAAPAPAGAVPALLRQLSSESGTLVRQEVALARAEMREKLGVYLASMAKLGIGAALLLAATLMGIWTLNSALTAMLIRWMGASVGIWLAPLLLTAALCAAGWALARGGRMRMAAEGLGLPQTVAALRHRG